MECKKGRAIRVREVAEKKIQRNDFQGARNSALAAKNIFPQLENISQLLAVCDVHCSAQKKICGSEKDWYGILQVERVDDEAAIKKQYRKLALLLHPDKNKFPGAEAAFKLIGEAHMVLSDKKRRLSYDSKHRASVTTAVRKKPPHQVNRKPVVRKSHDVQNINPNISTSQFSGTKHHQSKIPDLFRHVPALWTCPICKCQYLGMPVNKVNQCPNCFIARNLGSPGATPVSNQGNFAAQGVVPGSSRGQAAVSQQKQFSVPAFKVGAESNGQFTSSHLGSKVNSGGIVGSEQIKRTGVTTDIGADLNSKVKDVNRGGGMSNVYPAKARESGTSRDKNRKRGRKSSESCDTMSSSDSEEVVFEESKGVPAASQTFGQDTVHSCRRSSRQKQNISYSENVNDDDDFMSPQKRSAERKFMDGKDEQKESFSKEQFKGGIPAAEGLLYGNGEAGKHQVNVEEAVTLDTGAKKSSTMDDFGSNSTSGCTSNPVFYECPDPEFNNFDSYKGENCFSVDQIWACYDSIDGMPRIYALVRKVYSPGFKLRITWLETDPEKQGEIDWVNEDLPVGCGRFILGDTEETSDRLMFSHLIHFERLGSRGSFKIYPRKGETWALFKDWDIGWSSNPENHRKYKFEIVEILSDFGNDTGMKVGFLEKIKGFVSLFQQSTQGGVVSLRIPSNEVLRFSHRVPSFKMTGSERAGVEEGSFELDPASLPNDPNDL